MGKARSPKNTSALARRSSRNRLPLPGVFLVVSGAVGFAAGFCPVGTLTAQIPRSILDRVARLEVEDVTFEVAFRTLHRTSGVPIAFSPDRLPATRRVTCHCRQLTVREALDRLLEGTDLQYQAGRRQVLIGRLSSTPQPSAAPDTESGLIGVLEGRVLSSPDSLPMANAEVSVIRPVGSAEDTLSRSPGLRRLSVDDHGQFTLSLPPGRYHVTAESFGVEGSDTIEVGIRVGQTTRITILIPIVPIRLEEIVVAPSTFGMLRGQGPSGQFLTREELESQPGAGNDIFRAVEQLPGISTTDYSAKPQMRGARAGEVLTILDGLDLIDPYHIKEWGGSLSIVDMETISEVSLATGGFTSEFGDKSAGVFAMRSPDPPIGPPRTTIGLDFMSSIVKTQGTFHEGKGTWLGSARRGFLAFVFDLMNLYSDEDLRPSYYDLFSKVRYEVHPGHRLSAQILHAGDNNYGVEMDSTVYRVRFRNSYGWMNWEADLNQKLSAKTVASVARVAQDRGGTDYWEPGGPPVLRVDDQTSTWYLGLRQDWRYRHSDRMMLKWGLDLRWGTSDYEYFRSKLSYVPNLSDPEGPDWWPTHDTVTVVTSPSGSQTGAYFANRFLLVPSFTVEAGLRYDRQSHTGEQQISPRIQAAWQISPSTALRGAWGTYHQSHRIHEMWASDADTTFYPAQKAEHRVLGLDQRLGNGYSFRLEAYQRRLSDPLPEYRRVARNNGALWEEALSDRVFVQPERGRAEGIELFVKSPVGGRFSWSGSYTLSRVEEMVSGEWIPSLFDQRHAFNLQVTFRPTADWALAAAWIYHSPWPYTEVTFSQDQTVGGYPVFFRSPGQLNQERLTPYQRMDFRASRRFHTSKGDLLFYVDVFNLLNRENTLDLEQEAKILNGHFLTTQSFYPQLPMLPSVGLKWTF